MTFPGNQALEAIDDMPPASAAAQALSDALHREQAQQGPRHCAVLFDPVLRPVNAGVPWAAWLPASRQVLPLPDKYFIAQTKPWLACLNLERLPDSQALLYCLDDAFDEVGATAHYGAKGRRQGGVLAFDAAPAAVAQHLANLLVQYDELNRLVQLRLSDAAVLTVLWQWLDAAQRRALLGPVQVWWAVDMLGAVHRLSRGEPPAAAAAAADPGPAFALSAAQWADVRMIGYFNGALRRARQGWGDGAHALPEADLAWHLRVCLPALRWARDAGLTQREDFEIVGLLALTVHSRFFDDAELADLFERCVLQQQPFSAAFEAIDSLIWHRIAVHGPT